MNTPSAAALYARISSDRGGDALGVKRQLADCRAEARRRGWRVVEEYVDNDISAHSGKTRPEYRRLLADIEAGAVDAVIVYDLDRLHRRPKELEEFADTCARAGVDQLVTVHGDHKLGNADGMFVARILAAVAAQESDKKAQRVRRKMDELAEAGKPHGGATRPYGFDDDRITIRPDEAEIIRDVAERFLAGEPLQSLTNWLNNSGIPTVTGKRWRTSTVSGMLKSPRLSGQREHRGEIFGPAVWDPILTPEQTDRIRAKLADPSRRTSRTARRYLLAGLLRCAKCGAVLVSHPRKEVRRYVCKSGADFNGCGSVHITAERVEELIYESVLMRLDTPELADTLSGKHADNAHAAELAEQIAADSAKLEELATMWADDQITADEWKAARNRIETRRRQAEKRLRQITHTTVLDGLVGNGDRLRGQWSSLNLNRQREIVRAVLDHAVIGPGTNSGPRFDPSRVQAVWRL